MAANFDLTIRRGNNVPIAFQFADAEGELFDITGSEFILTIAWRGGTIRKDTAVDIAFMVDEDESKAVWSPTLAETRLLPAGRSAKYELERRVGSAQRTLLEGYVVVETGVGDD